jgi:peptide/nickel transport system substrate-binding protein
VINPSAVWSDGVPVTADDFIYAWQSQRGSGVDVDGQPDQVASTLGYRDVASVTPSHGGKTVTVVFATPYTDWRLMFDHMVPAHVARVVGWNRGFAAFNPAVELSAGPLILRSVSPEGTAVLVRNPKWWGTPSVLRTVTVTAPSNQASWTGAVAGSNVAVAQPVSFDLSSLSAVTSLPNAQSYVRPSLDLLQLEFNVTASLTAHPETRQAIAHAIDRTALLRRVFGAIDPDLVVNQDHLAAAWQTSYVPSSAAGEYSVPDPTATDHLLKSVGFRQNPQGAYVDGAGKPLTVRMAVQTGDPWIEDVANLISAELRSAGIAVVTIPVAGTAGMEAAVAANSYDMALVTRVASPFQSVTAAWFSDGMGPADSYGTQDWSKFDDPQVDQLFSDAAKALNPVTGGTIYTQIDDQLWDQMVALPLFEEPAMVAYGVQLANVEYNPSIDGLLWNAPLWTVLQPKPPGS